MFDTTNLLIYKTTNLQNIMSKETKNHAVEVSVEDKLKNLYQLQTILSEVDKIKTLRGELPLEVQDLEDEIEGLTTRIEKFQAEIEAMKKEINVRNGKIANSEMLVARFKEQLNQVRNNREYDSLNKEIELEELEITLNKKKNTEAQEQINEKQAEAQKSTTLVMDRRGDLDVKKSELDEIIQETKTEEDRLRAEAKELESKIEDRLLAAFKRIRKNVRNGLGVVYVQRDACGGCFNKIPPQRQLDIRMRKKVIVCEYCGRIMVDPELAGVEIAKPVEEKPKRRASRRKAE